MFGKRSNPGPSIAPVAAVSLTQHAASAPDRAASAVPEIYRRRAQTALPAPEASRISARKAIFSPNR